MNRFKLLNKTKISQLPKASGVYCFKRNQEILYIGKAANIKERIKNHFQQPTFKNRTLLNLVKQIGYIKTDSEITALILEAKLIKRYRPKYNIIWRDDKNYFFVGKTEEDFPRIFITHQPQKEIKGPKYQLKENKLTKTTQPLKAAYIGPFVDGKALKQTLNSLRKVFPFRSYRTIPKRPCLWYQIGRCPGPCLLNSPQSQQVPDFGKRIKKESQRNTKNLLRIFQGEKGQVLGNLKREMKLASTSQDYEKAAKIRDQIESLEKVMFHAKVFEPVEVKLQQIKKWKEIEIILEKVLKTKKEISRIEAYDISNIQGQEATGSLAAFIRGLPDKNLYRKFRIKIQGKPNDIAMIKEVLKRRLKHLEWGLPDLILIDGGKAQLNAAIEIRNQHKSAKSASISVLALAKKENKLYIESRQKPIQLKKLPREVFNLILQLRDEAHRFAIAYHRKLRKKGLFEI